MLDTSQDFWISEENISCSNHSYRCVSRLDPHTFHRWVDEWINKCALVFHPWWKHFLLFINSSSFFVSGVILFTFINCDEIPALVTSLIIGIGILFCGVASVQNVYLWQVSLIDVVKRSVWLVILIPPFAKPEVGKNKIQSGILFTWSPPIHCSHRSSATNGTFDSGLNDARIHTPVCKFYCK